MKLIQILFLLSLSLSTFASTADMQVDFTVEELVRAICKKTPFTSTKKCTKKKIKCIDANYDNGHSLNESILACFE